MFKKKPGTNFDASIIKLLSDYFKRFSARLDLKVNLAVSVDDAILIK